MMIAAALWALPAAAQTLHRRCTTAAAPPAATAAPPLRPHCRAGGRRDGGQAAHRDRDHAGTAPDVLPRSTSALDPVSGIFQNATDASKMNDWHMTTPTSSCTPAQVHKNVGVTLNLNANMVIEFSGAAVAVEDAIVSFDFMPSFTYGRAPAGPVDRANASGPVLHDPWNYPLPGAGRRRVRRPQQTHGGWGDISDGMLTYLAGVFDNANVGSSPLFSGRLRLALWTRSPVLGNGSYFGTRICCHRRGAQFQKHGSTVMMVDKDTPTSTPTCCSRRRSAAAGSPRKGVLHFTSSMARQRRAVRDGGVRQPNGGRRQPATHGPLPVGEGEGRRWRQPVEQSTARSLT